MCSSSPRSDGATKRGPSAEISAQIAVDPRAPSPTSVITEEAEVRALPSSATAWPGLCARSSTVRASTWTGTPMRPPSPRWRRMFRCVPIPWEPTPIFPRIPYSVTVCTTCPSGCSIVHASQESANSSSQSQVCIVSTDPVAPSIETTVVHSAGAVDPSRARISVRALSAATSVVSSPAPPAIPRISAAASGANPAIAPSASVPAARTSTGPPAKCANSLW